MKVTFADIFAADPHDPPAASVWPVHFVGPDGGALCDWSHAMQRPAISIEVRESPGNPECMLALSSAVSSYMQSGAWLILGADGYEPSKPKRLLAYDDASHVAYVGIQAQNATGRPGNIHAGDVDAVDEGDRRHMFNLWVPAVRWPVPANQKLQSTSCPSPASRTVWQKTDEIRVMVFAALPILERAVAHYIAGLVARYGTTETLPKNIAGIWPADAGCYEVDYTGTFGYEYDDLPWRRDCAGIEWRRISSSA